MKAMAEQLTSTGQYPRITNFTSIKTPKNSSPDLQDQSQQKSKRPVVTNSPRITPHNVLQLSSRSSTKKKKKRQTDSGSKSNNKVMHATPQKVTQTVARHRRLSSGPHLDHPEPPAAVMDWSPGVDSANVVSPVAINRVNKLPQKNILDYNDEQQKSTNSPTNRQSLFSYRKEGGLLSKLKPKAQSGDSQIMDHCNSSSMLIIQEQPPVDTQQSLETLNTHISVEETNTKTIGVSGIKPNGTNGSLTERQSQLNLLSQYSNSQSLVLQQLDTSLNAQGPSLNRRLERSLGPGGIRKPDNRHNGHFDRDAMINRLVITSGSTLKERASTVSRAVSTQVSPFQQNVLILNDRQLTNTDLAVYLLKHRTLDKIDVSSNKITRVPYPDLLNFSSSLTQLYLENNKIKEISEEALRQVPVLQLLKLRGNLLAKLPDSLFSLAGLKVLDVSCNNLRTFSPKVSLMRQLRLLNLAENQMEGLPNSMGYLASLESITSEFFIYLPDQYNGNNQTGRFTSMASSQVDPELDWISRHHRRMTMTYGGKDARLRKLMTFMRQQDDLMSTILDLVHEFQHLEGEYRIIDTEDIILCTQESDNIMNLLPTHQLPQQLEVNAQLSPASLQVYSQYLSRKEYNKLVTVFRMLSPYNVQFGQNQSNTTQTMLHFLVENGHSHLLTQFQHWIQSTLQTSLDKLVVNNASPYLISSLQTWFTNKLRQAVNCTAYNTTNERGLTALDVVVKAQSKSDMAVTFISLFGPYIELECLQQSSILNQSLFRPQSEFGIIVPGNLQSSGDPANDNKHYQNVHAKQKPHPIVIALSSGKFQLAGKLIDVALDFHIRRRNTNQSDQQLPTVIIENGEPYDSRRFVDLQTPYMPNTVKCSISGLPKIGALRTAASLQIELNSTFNLSGGDSESGLTFLHHIFTNFDMCPIKATNLFRKMNALHLKQHMLFNSRGLDSATRRVNSRSTASLRLAACLSPKNLHLLQQVSGNEITLQQKQFSVTSRKLTSSQTNIITGIGVSPVKAKATVNNKAAEITGDLTAITQEILPLQLNVLNHYSETPFDLAIEQFQNSGVQFALNWNYNHLQTIKHQFQSQGIQESASKDYFDVMHQGNSKQYTPLHRAVITGNFNAIKILLDSPLFYDAHILKKYLPKKARQMTLIDIHAQDCWGKTARDYSHKIVFMSKLMYQAYSKQVWAQAKLHDVKAELERFAKPKIQERQSCAGAAKSTILANYDKLIAHSSLVRQKPLIQLTGKGLMNPQLTLCHSKLNTVFMRRAETKFKLGKQSFISPVALGNGSSSARSYNDKRLIKSFGMNSSPMNKVHTPGQLKTKTVTPSGLGLNQHYSTRYDVKKKMAPLISVPQSTQGIKKAKNKTMNRMDSGKVHHTEAIDARQTRIKQAYDDTSEELDAYDTKSITLIQENESHKSLKLVHTVNNYDDSFDQSEIPLPQNARATAAAAMIIYDEQSEFMGSVQDSRKKDQSMLALARDQIMQRPICPKFPSKPNSDRKNKLGWIAIDAQKQDLKLADLDGADTRGNRQFELTETSHDVTNEFNESISASSFTPLPSIQNEYVLETKSFVVNQHRAPYSQQLATNCFRKQFIQIMDTQSDLGNTFIDGKLAAERIHFEAKALRPHQKIRILFDIVRDARQAYKLQDAKDVLDFIQFEIDSETKGQEKNRKGHQPKKPCGDSTPRGQPDLLCSAINQGNLFIKDGDTQNKSTVKAPMRLLFLQQEVKYLRCQLDFLSKYQQSTIKIQQTFEEKCSSHVGDLILKNPWSAATEKIKTSTSRNHGGGSVFSAKTEILNDSHLTEADQELSDDFDENQNFSTKTALVVQPSEILSVGPPKSARASYYSTQQSKLVSPGLARLLGKLDKKKQPQKLIKPKQNIQEIENLETEEGQTLINQPLVSAELPSFSECLSQSRGSAAVPSRKKMNGSSLSIKQATHRFQRKSTLANQKMKVGALQPKLKYAALGHIDLTTFDFNKKSLESNKKVAFGGKSCSVIDIPLSLTSMRRDDSQMKTSTRDLCQSSLIGRSLATTLKTQQQRVGGSRQINRPSPDETTNIADSTMLSIQSDPTYPTTTLNKKTLRQSLALESLSLPRADCVRQAQTARATLIPTAQGPQLMHQRKNKPASGGLKQLSASKKLTTGLSSQKKHQFPLRFRP